MAKADSPSGAEPSLILTQMTRQRTRLEQLANLMFQQKGENQQANELRSRCLSYCPSALSARMGGLELRDAREVSVLASNLRAEEIKLDSDIWFQRLGAWKQKAA